MSYCATKPSHSIFDTFFNATHEQRNSRTPSTDVYSDEKAYHLEVELPGYAKDEIGLEIKEGTLTIKANKKEHEEGTKRSFHIRERSHRAFERSFKLGDSLDADSVSAAHNNGILTVSINKKDKALPRAVTIK